MKKLCFITTVYGTIRSFILPFIKYAHENTGWDISIICNDSDEFRKILPDYVHFFPVQMERGISLSGLRACMEIKRIFSREKFDMIQYSTPNASIYASTAGMLAGIPVRLYCQWGLVYVGFSGIKRRIFRMEERFVCSLSTWVEPDSVGNLNFAHSEKLYPEHKGSVIGYGSACGVNLEKFDIGKKKQQRTVIREMLGVPGESFIYIFVGRITKDKGVTELLTAFQNILNKQPDSYLIMAGTEEHVEELDRNAFAWSKDSDHVKYIGRTPEVEKYLSASDCYLLPSYREGFGMGTIEAEAMGVPVIVTDIPGPRDAMLPDVTGYLVPIKNSAALADSMLAMQHADSETMGNNGYKLVLERFEQKAFLAEMLEDRKRLLGEI